VAAGYGEQLIGALHGPPLFFSIETWPQYTAAAASNRRASLPLGKTSTLGAKVTPAFKGCTARVHRGMRHAMAFPGGGASVWHTNWTALGSKALKIIVN
jgi:hypothetical protein